MHDQTTSFVEGETAYYDSGDTLTPVKVDSVKPIKSRGGLRHIVKAGKSDYNGDGSPRTSFKWSRVMLRKRTPDLDARYQRQCNETRLMRAQQSTKDWNDEELSLIAEALTVAAMMRKQRLNKTAMTEEQLIETVKALPREGGCEVQFSGLNAKEMELKVRDALGIKDRWSCYISSEAFGVITLRIRPT